MNMPAMKETMACWEYWVELAAWNNQKPTVEVNKNSFK
jgi:hypothetical protein